MLCFLYLQVITESMHRYYSPQDLPSGSSTGRKQGYHPMVKLGRQTDRYCSLQVVEGRRYLFLKERLFASDRHFVPLSWIFQAWSMTGNKLSGDINSVLAMTESFGCRRVVSRWPTFSESQYARPRLVFPASCFPEVPICTAEKGT